MRDRMILIIGGAGSGKSAFAEQLCCRLPGERVYLAVMIPRDEESRARVMRHRENRAGKEFWTIEQGLDIENADIPAGANLLLEDLSNLLANEMFEAEGKGAEAVRRGIARLNAVCGSVTVVTNDVFSDGRACSAESLAYMKELAALNRELADSADAVAEIVCGLPNVLKGRLP